jgi:hypothetical protein
LRAHPGLPAGQRTGIFSHATRRHRPSFPQADLMLCLLSQLKFAMQSTDIQTATRVCAASPQGQRRSNFKVKFKLISHALDCCSSALCLATCASPCDCSRICAPMASATALHCTQDSLQLRSISQHASRARRARCSCRCWNSFMVIARMRTNATILNVAATCQPRS